ncbi:MAG: flagellar biosynthesis protein FlhA [Spirochaetes bacterium]|nr:flagellar biosynthesis protein FlhA [Spirochaetota bacterium]
MADTFKIANIARFAKSPDLIIVIFVIVTIMMLIIPVSGFVLDFMMSLSISTGLLVMILVIFSKSPLDLSIFPSLLLILTLFRLAINVSSTRLILIKGPQFNGQLVKSFGNFVVAGNYIVGIIIFIILIAVQYIVITKGTTRVSEVAARFALDSLPGKQMSIDSDLAAGIITEQEAIRRRLELQREADFYGDMDGASKFISGDVIVGILITFINSIGGILIGIFKFNMDITSAVNTFLLFTVGDGLVSQIPSILNSTAAGIIMTRSSANNTLGIDFFDQIKKQYKPLWIISGIMLFFAFLPGFPKLAVLLLALMFGAFAYFLGKKEEAVSIKEKEEKEKEKEKPTTIDRIIPVDPIALEIGYSLIPLVDKSQGGDLFDRIVNVRKQIAYDYGMIVPTISVRDSLKLDPNQYMIKINGVEAATFEVYPDKLLAINPGTVSEQIEGKIIAEPAYGLPSIWIDPKDKNYAESLGYTVIDSSTVIITHLTEVIIQNVDSLLGREEVKKIIDSVKEMYPTLVSEIDDKKYYGVIQKILQKLLLEKVSIRNITTIFETISDNTSYFHNPDIIVEFIRQKLKNQICAKYADSKGYLYIVQLDAKLENYLASEFEKIDKTGVTSINPEYLNKLINVFVEKEAEVYKKGYEYFIVVVSNRLRRHLRNLFSSIIPKAVFLSFDELSKNYKIEVIDVIKID